MLSLKEAEDKLKELGLVCKKIADYEYEFELTKEQAFNEKTFEKWKTAYIKKWTAYDVKQEAYYQKHYPTVKYYKYITQERVTDKYLKQAFLNSFRNSGKILRFSELTSTLSCAIPEFGTFTTSKSELSKHWGIFFQWYVAQSKWHYFKCATPATPKFSAVRKGLKEAGFEMRAREKTKHGGLYWVEVWEYIKPEEKKKRVKKDKK